MAFFDFTGSDGDPLPVGLTTNSGTFEIQSNALTATAVEAICTATGSPNGFVESTFNGRGNTNSGTTGLCFRYSDNNNQFTVIIRTSDGRVAVFKKEAGGFAGVGTNYNIPAMDASADYVIRVEFDGADIEVFVDGISRITGSSTFNQTATEHGLRFGTTLYSMDDLTVPDVAASGTITLTTTDFHSQQQVGGNATFNLTGAYTDTPTTIEYSSDGVNYFVGDATPSGNAFDFPVTLPTGQYTITVRFSNDTGVNDGIVFVTVGDGYLLTGQSNMSGRGTNNQTYTAGAFKYTLLGNDDVFREIIDPIDSDTDQVDTISSDPTAAGTWNMRLAHAIASSGSSTPVFFIPCSKGGTMSSQWGVGSALYNSSTRRAALTGGVSKVLFELGESDCASGTLDTVYESNITATFAGYKSDLGVDTLIVALHLMSATYDGNGTTTGQIPLRAAQVRVADDNANVTITAPLTPLGIPVPDGVHFKSDGDLNSVGVIVFEALNSSTLNMTVLGAGNDTLTFEFYNRATKTHVKDEAVTFSNDVGAVSFTIAVGSVIGGFYDGATPPTTGTGFYGVTE